MTVVVADTSPLNYLILIGQIGTLRHLYGKIILPSEVLAELVDAETPPEVRAWAQSRPEWLEIRVVQGNQHDPALERIDR